MNDTEKKQAELDQIESFLSSARIERDTIEKQKLQGIKDNKELQDRKSSLVTEIDALIVKKQIIDSAKNDFLNNKESELRQATEKLGQDQAIHFANVSNHLKMVSDLDLRENRVKNTELETINHQKTLTDKENKLKQISLELDKENIIVNTRQNSLDEIEKALQNKESGINTVNQLQNVRQSQQDQKEKDLNTREQSLTSKESSLIDQSKNLQNQIKELNTERAELNVKIMKFEADQTLFEQDKIKLMIEFSNISDREKAVQTRELELAVLDKDISRRENAVLLKEELLK